jgi:hypothetical protein
MNFQLADIINVAEFTTLFDRYRITGVQLTFMLVTNPDAGNPLNVNVGGNNSNFYPKLWWVRDYDDGNAITLSQMRERETCKHKILRPNSEIKIFLKPAALLQTYRTALTTGYAPKWKQWIDLGQTDVPHYGFKFVVDMDGNVPNGTFYIRMEKKYYFQCKDVR